MSKNVIKFLSVMLVLTWTLSAEGAKSGSVDRAGSHLGLHYSENGSTGEADALTGPIVLPRKEYTQRFNRGTADTMSYDSQVGWGGQFIQSPGDAMLMMYQLPADATLKGVNIPIYEWGTGDQEFSVSVHKLSYPMTADGETAYSSDAVDGDGWIGGYDMAEDGSVSIEGSEYTAGGTVGICSDGANAVAEGATDPLGFEAGFGPPGVPVMGLVWPDGVTAVTMTPETHGDYAVDGITDHWINFSDFGSEPALLAGEWVGIMVAYTGDGGGDDEATGFFYAEGNGVVSPWAFMKFYAGCGGTSGNGGWHIRHWLIRYNLAVELTGDRAPVISGVTPLYTTMSNDARDVVATIADDNPSGGAAGVGSAVLHVYPMPSHAYQTFDMTDNGDGTYSSQIPGMDAGTEIYWWITASDVEGNETETTEWYYSIFQATQPTLFFYNSAEYGSFIAGYYMYGLSHPYDFWDGANYGAATSDLLGAYESVIEMTGGGPSVINSEAVGPWFAEGGKNYVLAGDEWLGAQSGWANTDYVEGDFQYDVLGIDADYNDINYGASGDQDGVSRLEAVEGDAISGALHSFLADSLVLNYDPNYELGISNWLDGVDVVDGFSNSFNAYSTVLDTFGVLSDDAVAYAAGPYKAHDNGSNSVFLSFDPLCLNSTPYHWIGIQSFGALHSAVVWADMYASVGDEDTNPLAQSFELLGNYPNPFNPTTNIAFNLNVRSDVTVRIFSVLGEEIATLQSGNLASGTNMVSWNGTNNFGQSVASGLYIYQVEAGQQSLTGKMMQIGRASCMERV